MAGDLVCSLSSSSSSSSSDSFSSPSLSHCLRLRDGERCATNRSKEESEEEESDGDEISFLTAMLKFKELEKKEEVEI